MRERHRIAIGLIVAGMLGWSASADAASKKTASATASKKTSSAREVVGTVTAVKMKDVGHTDVTIKADQGRELVLEMDYETTIWQNSRPASRMAIKAGTVLKVTYEVKGKKNIAKAIIIRTSAPR